MSSVGDLLRSLLLGSLVALVACSEPELVPPPLILITLDTTNPGTLDPYRSGRNLTPHLAGLAAEGLVFEEARTVAPLTLNGVKLPDLRVRALASVVVGSRDSACWCPLL